MGQEIINITDQPDWIKKTIEIKSSDDNVWTVLTNPDLVKQWAKHFMEGIYVISDFTESSAITWKSETEDHGMSGIVEVSYPAKMLKTVYSESMDDSQDSDMQSYREHYLLTEAEGNTTLVVEAGPMSKEHIETSGPQWDEALRTIKSLSENL